jgi:hypothetical protein
MACNSEVDEFEVPARFNQPALKVCNERGCLALRLFNEYLCL